MARLELTGMTVKIKNPEKRGPLRRMSVYMPPSNGDVVAQRTLRGRQGQRPHAFGPNGANLLTYFTLLIWLIAGFAGLALPSSVAETHLQEPEIADFTVFMSSQK